LEVGSVRELRMASVLGGDNERVAEGAERWEVTWYTAIRSKECPDEMVDQDAHSRAFPNPIAARRWARNALKRRLDDFGQFTVQAQVAQQAEYAPAGVGEWMDVGEKEYVD
jgi:hypothetical protein